MAADQLNQERFQSVWCRAYIPISGAVRVQVVVQVQVAVRVQAVARGRAAVRELAAVEPAEPDCRGTARAPCLSRKKKSFMRSVY